MSTLKVTTIQDTAGSNSSTSAEIFQGRAKAWVRFDGTGTVAIDDDYNVSSITDNGRGRYTVNFDTSLTDANYSVVASCAGDSVNGDSAVCVDIFTGADLGIIGADGTYTAPTTSSFILGVFNPTNNNFQQDSFAICAIVYSTT